MATRLSRRPPRTSAAIRPVRIDQFNQVLSAAVDDLIENGYDSPERLAFWQQKLKEAADDSLMPEHRLTEMLREALTAEYTRMIDKGGILRLMPGVSSFTVQRLRPELKKQLDARILASANLIKLNREQEVRASLRRFAGWATSIPTGGTTKAKKQKAKETIRKSLAGLSYRERRVLIDQGQKLTSAISEVVATGGGAIAGVWRSNWRQANYDYREDHKERDGQFYLVRDSWALKNGLVKPAGYQYVDEITRPGEEVYCRCYYRWITSLNKLPPDMLTEKGKAALRKAA